MADDFSELTDLFRDLTEVAELIPKKAAQAVQQTAMRTKKSWVADAKKSMPKRVAKSYAPTIDFALHEFGAFGQGVYEAEIGPNLERYGGKTGKGGLMPSFGFLDDPDGSGGIRVAPSRARQRAEKFAVDDLTKGIEIAVEQSMKARGL